MSVTVASHAMRTSNDTPNCIPVRKAIRLFLPPLPYNILPPRSSRPPCEKEASRSRGREACQSCKTRYCDIGGTSLQGKRAKPSKHKRAVHSARCRTNRFAPARMGHWCFLGRRHWILGHRLASCSTFIRPELQCNAKYGSKSREHCRRSEWAWYQ